MNTLKKIYFVALLCLCGACSKQYVEPNSFSDVAWYTSGFRQTVLNLSEGDFMSFADLSQGTLSHKWEIKEGNLFLKGPITRTDSVLTNFVIPGGALETQDKTIHVLFPKAGTHEVRLRNTFKDSVTFIGNEIVRSVKEGNLWVIDKVFVVDVYEKVVPAIEIRQDGLLKTLSTDTLYVKQGGALEFKDVTTVGRPDFRTWNVAGQSSIAATAKIVFDKLGVYTASVTVGRQSPNIPPTSTVLRIPNPIKVSK